MTNFPRPGGFPEKMADLERRLYALERRSSGYPESVAIQTFLGPWGTLVPGPTDGVLFTCRGGILRGILAATAYTLAAPQDIGIEVYLDGVFVAGLNRFVNESSSHKTLNPNSFEASVLAGDHFLAYRIATGTSDSTDFGSMFAVVVDV
jgi:hypothetical protein